MHRRNLVIFLTLILNILPFSAEDNSSYPLTKEQQVLLEVTAGVHFTFQSFAQKIWPGYNLSQQPYVLHLPDVLTLLINSAHAPGDFMPYPSGWPNPGATVWLYEGSYPGLVGQFVFGFPLDSLKVFAMGLPTELVFSLSHPALRLFQTTVHEGFHYFQFQHFGEIPWAREERYPILDTTNTALASLEMQILMDALRAMFKHDSTLMHERLKDFLTVRTVRWQQREPFIRQYEQGQEINEGTARYVEMKATQCLFALRQRTIENPLLQAFEKSVDTLNIQQLLLEDFNQRLKSGVVTPENMLRNRIYPVGATLGFLLDALGIQWKSLFQQAGRQVAFHELLRHQFPMDSVTLYARFEQVKDQYGYPLIYQQAKKNIEEYFRSYRRALQAFNRQKGVRIVVQMPSQALQRFRSTREKRWVMEKGGKILCLNYNLYKLKSLTGEQLYLELHDTAVLEENNWQRKRKTVVFFIAMRPHLFVDGEEIPTARSFQKTFHALALKATGAVLQLKAPGTIRLSDSTLVINVQ